jgi:hypothetical protein
MPDDSEKFANAKVGRYWRLREHFQRGEVSGLTDDMLAELTAVTWLVDPRNRIAIEGKADVKAALGHSPDLDEAMMIAIGEGAPIPCEYREAPPPVKRAWAMAIEPSLPALPSAIPPIHGVSPVCLAELEDQPFFAEAEKAGAT